MTTQKLTPPLDERLFMAGVGALELFGVYLGDRLGLYERLAQGDALTPAELAAACKIHPRYAREWLEQQAVAGVLTVDDASAPAERRRYALPASHAGVVADPSRPEHLAPLARMIVGIAGVIDQVVAAYRSGAGVPYARYGTDFRHGQGGINRPAFAGPLVRDWLPAMSAGSKLTAGARVADLGCGQGFAAISVAQAFPSVEVWGIDGDPSSIEDARRFAAAAGANVRFECADGAALAEHGPFDVVMLLEVLHDLARPADVLKAARRALGPDGAVLVADEKVAGQFTAPGDDLERMMYGWSISHCLPTQMVDQPSAAIGTVIRESTVRELAGTAGFGRVDVLDVDGGFFRIYELRR